MRRGPFRHRRPLLLALAALVVGCAEEAADDPGDPDPYPWPGAEWASADPSSVGMDPVLLAQARDYALTGGGSGTVVRFGKVVSSWGDPKLLYELKSTSKSIGSLLLGIAIAEGRLGMDHAAQQILPTFGDPPPENAGTGWLPAVTVRMLTTHTGGFSDTDGYGPIAYPPGTAWLHSDTGVDWLADVLTTAYGEDLLLVLRSRVLGVVGVDHTQLTWRISRFREPTLNGIVRREMASGIHASVDALARLGYLCLRQGTWDGNAVVPPWYIQNMCVPDPSLAALPNNDEVNYPAATRHYAWLWWTNRDGTLPNVPADAFFSWGLGESVLLVIPSLDIVAARAGEGWRAGWDSDYSVIAPFIEPIAQSVLPEPPPASIPITP